MTSHTEVKQTVTIGFEEAIEFFKQCNIPTEGITSLKVDLSGLHVLRPKDGWVSFTAVGVGKQ